jgi:hypothetical protein
MDVVSMVGLEDTESFAYPLAAPTWWRSPIP